MPPAPFIRGIPGRVQNVNPVPLLVALALAAGCQAPSDPALEARQVLERYYEANTAEDWPAVWSLISEESKAGQTYEQFLEPLKGPGQVFSRAITARSSYEVLETRVDGDEAEIEVLVRSPSLSETVTLEGGLSHAAIQEASLVDQQVTMSLVREQEGWKVRRKMAKPEDRDIRERRRKRLLEREMHKREDLGPESGEAAGTSSS
jgi:hypothetical protein